MRITIQIYTISIFLLMAFAPPPTVAQVPETFNNYYVQIAAGDISPDTFQIIILIAADPLDGARKLGTSNFQLTYNANNLANPRISGHSLTAAYNSIKVNQPTENKVSFNISLDAPGTGIAIASYPALTEVGRITFDVRAFGASDFAWTDLIPDTKETVVYYDDEVVLRHPVQMFDLQNQVLSLNLQHFSVNWKNQNQNDAVLNWVTASENGTEAFEIERSYDGINDWKKIGELAAKGTNNFGTDYTYEDVQVSFFMPSKFAYYRLKERSENGDFAYSDVRVLVRSNSMEQNYLNVFPNPIQSGLLVAEFNLNNQISQYIDLIVCQSNGITIFERKYTQNERRRITIDTQDYPPGVYTIFIRQGKESIAQKFVKLP